MTTLATYNANNLFVRYKFPRLETPGAASSREIVAAALGSVYDDRSEFRVCERERRVLAAKALAEPDGTLPDILCLQEVESLDTLRVFNAGYLGEHYPHLFLLHGADRRRLDVGVMSRFPVLEIRTHVDERDPLSWVQRGSDGLGRDCLEVTFALPEDELTIFANHFKSRLVETAGRTRDEIDAATLASHEHRRRQATRVAELIHGRFAGREDRALFAAIGDFNDTPSSPWVRPLTRSPLLVDVLAQTRAANDCWTYYSRAANRVAQTDYVLCSPALARRVTKTHIERRGLAYERLSTDGELLPARSRLCWIEDDGVTPIAGDTPPEQKVDFRFPRYPEVLADWKKNVSDHCPVRVWF